MSQSGNGLRLAPLQTFAATLKAFWEPATGTPFGYEVEHRTGVPDGRAPKSAATRLVWEAVQYLTQDYTLANVGTVIPHPLFQCDGNLVAMIMPVAPVER